MHRLICVFVVCIWNNKVLSWRGLNVFQCFVLQFSYNSNDCEFFFTDVMNNTCILILKTIWVATWQNQQNECAPSEDSDQPGHLPSLIRVFAVRMKKAWVLSYPLSAQRRLWLDWADAQADLSLRWAHSHFVGFVMSQLILKIKWQSFIYFSVIVIYQ